MVVELDIVTALNAHVNSLTTPLDVVFSNYSFDRDRQPHIAVATLPRETDAAYLGDSSTLDYGGVYQLSINTKAGQGETECVTQASNAIAHFRRGLMLSSGDVNVRLKQPYRSPPMFNGVLYTIVVSVPYRAIIKPQY